jgi:uncharacterized protein (DUF2141 family)
MKKTIFFLTMALWGYTFKAFPQSGTSTGTLTIEVTGFTSNVGQAVLELFRKNDKVPTGPSTIQTATIANKKAVFTINNLVFDDYAILVYHDQNSNNEIDHSFGIPAEPLGYSNNWELSLYSGMPTFEKLRFSFTQKTEKIKIQMSE